MRPEKFPLLLLLGFAPVLLAVGQTLDSFGVSKKLDYLQSSAATPASQTIIGDPNGPFHFSADIVGSSLNLFSPIPKVTLPNATQYNLVGGPTSMGLSATYAGKSALDTAFANGTYNFTVGATTYPAILGTTDAYPAEIPKLTNGTWDGVGKLVLDAGSGATLNFNSFSNYTGGVGGIIYFNLYAVNGNAAGAELVAVESLALTGFPSDPALTAYTVAPGFLQADRTYYGELSFARIVSLNTSFLPAVGLSTFMRTTGFMITTASPATAPVINTQPAGQTVSVGATVAFTVSASGNPAPTYQWRKDGVALTGATLGSYNLGNVQAGDAGSYTVVVSNAAGQVTSAVAVLTVTAATTAPQITTQPASQTVLEGATVTFTAAASGSPAPVYQWKKNGTPIGGATGSSLVLNNVQAGDAGSYTVEAGNTAGTAASNAAVLTVTPLASAPVITTQPAGQTASVGATVTFSVAASGSPAPGLQWRKNGTDIPGATSAVLSLPAVQPGDAGSYVAVATNSAGSASSAAATLTIRTASPSGSGDFNGDGKSDIIWQNSATGERAIWLLNGTSFLASSTLGIFPLEWTVAATGDFNFDGKPDIVWSNSVTGERALWLMDGTLFIASSTLGIFPLEWTVAATGDFNFDGKPDIVWSNSVTGERALWLMDGTLFLAASTLGIFPLEWTVVGTADFNLDGSPDLIWSNSVTGERAIWLMSGTQFLASASLGIFPLEWTVVH